MTKVSETEVNLTEQELGSLLSIIKPDPDAFRVKDGTYYELAVGSNTTPVDLEKVPDEYKTIFNRLKNDLKIVR